VLPRSGAANVSSPDWMVSLGGGVSIEQAVDIPCGAREGGFDVSFDYAAGSSDGRRAQLQLHLNGEVVWDHSWRGSLEREVWRRGEAHLPAFVLDRGRAPTWPDERTMLLAFVNPFESIWSGDSTENAVLLDSVLLSAPNESQFEACVRSVPELAPAAPPHEALADLTVPLQSGWSWLSLNVLPPDLSVNSVFSGVAFEQGDLIKSQTSFAQFYSGYGFFGGLATVSLAEMYAVNMGGSGGALAVSGTPVSLPMDITLRGGWTFLPMPYQVDMSVDQGLPAFAYETGDELKSQLAFSGFYESYGWFGTLTTLSPGAGYKLKTTGGSGTFQRQQR